MRTPGQSQRNGQGSNASRSAPRFPPLARGLTTGRDSSCPPLSSCSTLSAGVRGACAGVGTGPVDCDVDGLVQDHRCRVGVLVGCSEPCPLPGVSRRVTRRRMRPSRESIRDRLRYVHAGHQHLADDRDVRVERASEVVRGHQGPPCGLSGHLLVPVRHQGAGLGQAGVGQDRVAEHRPSLTGHRSRGGTPGRRCRHT
jgi:hypothetical protein